MGALSRRQRTVSLLRILLLCFHWHYISGPDGHYYISRVDIINIHTYISTTNLNGYVCKIKLHVNKILMTTVGLVNELSSGKVYSIQQFIFFQEILWK